MHSAPELLRTAHQTIIALVLAERLPGSGEKPVGFPGNLPLQLAHDPRNLHLGCDQPVNVVRPTGEIPAGWLKPAPTIYDRVEVALGAPPPTWRAGVFPYCCTVMSVVEGDGAPATVATTG